MDREQIIKALEICGNQELDTCKDCPYAENYINCNELIAQDALALIKEQDEQIFKLENRLKENENGYSQTLFLEKCKNKDLTEKNKELGFYPFPHNIETRPKNIQALTPEQHIVKHIHCDISKEFLEEYKAEIEKATANAIISAIKEKYGV